VQADDVFRHQLLGVIPRLRRYARSLVFDNPAADDLVQTTLERALAHWHQFDQRRDLLVWVLSIAHNAHLDQRRRDARLSVVDPSAPAPTKTRAAATPSRRRPAHRSGPRVGAPVTRAARAAPFGVG
jgi:RNA polymerase sigma-70 factor (ECF subfamily)